MNLIKSSMPLGITILCCAAAFANDSSQPAICLPDQYLVVNNIHYLGNKNQIIKALGKPLSSKIYTYDSGNTTYQRIKMFYSGAMFISQQQQPQQIEQIEITGKSYRIGPDVYIGMPKKQLMRSLHIGSESQLMDIEEAKRFYGGEEITRLNQRKKSWDLATCNYLYANVTSVHFYFDQADKLIKYKIVYDDSSI